LSHCATSRKVAVSIPDGVIDLILQAAMGAVREIRTQKYFLGGKGGRSVGVTTLPTLCTDCL